MAEEIKGGIESKEENKKEQKPVEDNEPKVVIQIIMLPNGSLQLKSSLIPPMVIYAFESLKFNLMKDMEKKIIVEPPQGGMLNFARGIFNKKK